MAERYRDLLKQRGFMAFVASEAINAFNDNLFKIALTFLAVAQVTGTHDSGLVSWIGALFTLPYLVCSGFGGNLADHYNKRHILIISKVAEFATMVAAMVAFDMGQVYLLLGILVVAAVQAALNSPAKYGIIPEMVPDHLISKANGLVQMTMYVSIILGTVVAGWLYERYATSLIHIGYVLVAFGALNIVCALLVTRVASPIHPRPIVFRPLHESFAALREMRLHRPIRLSILAMTWFWFVGALLQMLLIIFGTQDLGVTATHTSQLLMYLMVGIAAGSLIAGWLSGDHVELGLIPVGGFGLTVGLMMVGFSAPHYFLAAAGLTIIGLSGGLFIVPLNAFLQRTAPVDRKGQVMAANNIINTIGMLFSTLVIKGLYDLVGLSASEVMLVIAVLNVVVLGFVVRFLPEQTVYFLLEMVVRFVYRIRVVGAKNVPAHGPVLYVANHVSYVDGFLVAAAIRRRVRFVMLDRYYNLPFLKPLFQMMGVIPMRMTGKGMIRSLEEAREALLAGESVCLFPEGALTRNGVMSEFRAGFERIMEGLDHVPIVPVYLDGVWGSIFSAKGGKFIRKWPERFPYPVTAVVGDALPAQTTAFQLQQVMMELGATAYGKHVSHPKSLARAWIKSAKRHCFQRAVVDSSGVRMRYGRLLMASLIVADFLKRIPGSAVGILLPASVGGCIANLGGALAGRTLVNLNFTAGDSALAGMIEQAGIQDVISSEKFKNKVSSPDSVRVLEIEAILMRAPLWRKIKAFIQAYFVPTFLLMRMLPDAASIATIVFSSGSMGKPKGVMLSQQNILSNVTSISQLIPLQKGEFFAGFLPFFHSFGFTGTIWLPLLHGYSVVYHPNPLDAKIVGRLISEHQVKLMISTPTFCRLYARSCAPESFQSLEFCVVGAEKLQEQVRQEFLDRFGVELLEGYGCTELSPVVSLNLPDVQSVGYKHVGQQIGTVGHPISYVAVKVTDVESGVACGAGESGLLWVKGPNVMVGYLGQADLTSQVIQDGWYQTGDIATLGRDGFITIVDRLSRFAKIGGEMVSLGQIEAVMHGLMLDIPMVATAVPCMQKGERIALLYAGEVSVDQLLEEMKPLLPALWIPKKEAFIQVDAIPLLATGKVDLTAVRRLVLEKIS